MLFLGKVFEVRGKAHGDEEKPFLDHLEDLRIMITRIVITLLVATLGCWIFHTDILDIIRKPVHEVWNDRQENKLPEGVSIDNWEKIKRIQAAAAKLRPEERDHYYDAFGDNQVKFRAQAASYYIIALEIPEEQARKKWIDSLHVSDEQKDFILELIEKGPAPELDAKSKVVDMKSLKPTETFMLAFKVAFFAGLIISFPLILFYILQFVLPGLKENEKKILWPSMAVGFGLFLGGVLFAYFFVLPRALDFFFSFGTSMSVDNEWRIGEYITFVTQFTIIFGLAFELPVLVMALVKLGLLGFQTMSNTRSYAVLGIVIIAAVITPTGDALTLSMLAVPMYLLYEGCIWLSYLDYKKQMKAEAAEFSDEGVRETPQVSSAAGAISMSPHSDEDEDFENEDDYSSYQDPETQEEGYETNLDSEEGEMDSDSYEENLAQQNDSEEDDESDDKDK